MKRLWPSGIVLGIIAAGLLLFASAAGAASGAPEITHSLAGRDACLMCHSAGGSGKPVPATHTSFTNAMCLSCHTVAAATATPTTTTPTTGGGCLDCHGKPGQTMTLSSGEKLSISVDSAMLTSSVHGN